MARAKRRSITLRIWIATADHEPDIHSSDDVCWSEPTTGWVSESPQMRWERATAVITSTPTQAKAPDAEEGMTIDALDFIRKAAEVAASVGHMSRTGGMEMAGRIVSVLAAHPEHLPRFMAEGAELLIDGTIAVENGCLSFMAINGTINTPSNLRKRKGLEQ